MCIVTINTCLHWAKLFYVKQIECITIITNSGCFLCKSKIQNAQIGGTVSTVANGVQNIVETTLHVIT